MHFHELEFSTFPNENFVDLMPYQYGREYCEPGHAFGPARRSHYLFHYIITGKGTLISTDPSGAKHTYSLSGGEGFLIYPGQINTYVADLEDPWEYIWIEFDGIRVKEALELVGFSQNAPVYRSQDPVNRQAMENEMRYLVGHRDVSAMHLIGHTYLFLDYLTQSVERPKASTNKLQDFYIHEALSYIKQNYQNDISIEDIAKKTGLNRSYFGKVFKSVVKKSPQQYLINYRMSRAAELLKLTTLPVGDVGKSVGYPNQLHFSRAFKSVYGISPRDWRKEHTRGA